ncbi:MAG: hypothetical protein LBS20_01345 [Prevotella sp.]|nr:hypothetical protein [Prevotella sp.]
MIFIESRQVAGSVAERFHFVMGPFFQHFNNYVKFISCFKACFTFRVTEESGYIQRLKDNVEKVAGLGGQSIISGENYPTGYFTAKELDSICRTINDIWYCVDMKQNYIDKYLDFDSHYAQIIGAQIKEYMEAISPGYKGMQLTKDTLAKYQGTSLQIYTGQYSISFPIMIFGKRKKRNSRCWH